MMRPWNTVSIFTGFQWNLIYETISFAAKDILSCFINLQLFKSMNVLYLFKYCVRMEPFPSDRYFTKTF